MNSNHWRGLSRLQNRGGYTLTELLVVIIILIILLAVTLPAAKKVMEDSRTRESSRQLSAYFTMARARAAQSGRPCGLWLELDTPIGVVDPPTTVSDPFPIVVRQCTQLYMAEVPQMYSGGTLAAKGIIRTESGQTVAEFVPLSGVDNSPADGVMDQDMGEKPILLSLIEQGEFFVVKFNYKGDWYKCFRGISTNTTYPDPNRLYYIGALTTNITPPGYNSNTSGGFPYQILRSPRRVGNPLELTGGTAIDMSYSGMGPDGIQFNLVKNHLLVMFMPSGAIDGLIADGLPPQAPEGTIHFLVSRVEKINRPIPYPLSSPNPTYGGQNTNHVSGYNMFDPATSNLADPLSLWVSVGRLNGSVTTSENYPDADHINHTPSDGQGPWGPEGREEYVHHARELATGREQMGAK